MATRVATCHLFIGEHSNSLERWQFSDGPIDCMPGTFTDSANVLKTCHPCGRDSFAAAGASECIECPAGRVFIKSSQTCDNCEPGQFYEEGALSCSECAYNQFSVYENQRLCRYCMPGSFARRGSTTCFACPPGQVYIAETDECGECLQNERYEFSDARCEFDYVQHETPLPELFEELDTSIEPMSELAAESDEEQPTVTNVPI